MEPKQQKPYPLRMPPELRNALEEAANAGGRSLHSEIIARLASSVVVASEGDAADRSKKALISLRHHLEYALQNLDKAEHRVFAHAHDLDTEKGGRAPLKRIDAFAQERAWLIAGIDRLTIEMAALKETAKREPNSPATQTLLNLHDRLSTQRSANERRLKQVDRVISAEIDEMASRVEAPPEASGEEPPSIQPLAVTPAAPTRRIGLNRPKKEGAHAATLSTR